MGNNKRLKRALTTILLQTAIEIPAIRLILSYGENSIKIENSIESFPVFSLDWCKAGSYYSVWIEPPLDVENKERKKQLFSKVASPMEMVNFIHIYKMIHSQFPNNIAPFRQGTF